MYHVFVVNRGRLVLVELEGAMKSVGELKRYVEKECGIKSSQQIMLMSNGTLMEDRRKAIYYQAGTENNPAFVYDRMHEKFYFEDVRQYRFQDYSAEVSKLKLCRVASHEGLTARAKLALALLDNTREQVAEIDKLAGEVHLLIRGWSASVGNMQSTLKTFEEQKRQDEKECRRLLDKKPELVAIVDSMDSVLDALRHIPFLPNLMTSRASDKSAAAESSDATVTPSSGGDKGEVPESLLSWIETHSERRRMGEVVEHCRNKLRLLTQEKIDALVGECERAMADGGNKQVLNKSKELQERMADVARTAANTGNEQKIMATSIVSNRDTAYAQRGLIDQAAVDTLCESTLEQLYRMCKNERHTREALQLCIYQKNKLMETIQGRTKWLYHVQRSLLRISVELCVFGEHMRRCERQADFLKQVRIAAEVYASLLVESARRRMFSRHYTEWCKEVRSLSDDVCKEEVVKRTNFQSKLGHHFLQELFPGFADRPERLVKKIIKDLDRQVPEIDNEQIKSLARSCHAYISEQMSNEIGKCEENERFMSGLSRVLVLSAIRTCSGASRRDRDHQEEEEEKADNEKITSLEDDAVVVVGGEDAAAPPADDKFVSVRPPGGAVENSYCDVGGKEEGDDDDDEDDEALVHVDDQSQDEDDDEHPHRTRAASSDDSYHSIDDDDDVNVDGAGDQDFYEVRRSGQSLIEKLRRERDDAAASREELSERYERRLRDTRRDMEDLIRQTEADKKARKMAWSRENHAYDQLHEAEERCGALESEVRSLRAHLMSKTSEMARQQAQHELADDRHHMRAHERTEEHRRQLAEARAELAAHQERTEHESARLLREIESKATELHSAEERVQELESELSRAEMRLQALERELSAEREAGAALRERLTAANERGERWERLGRGADDGRRETEEKLAQADRKCSDLQRMLGAFETESQLREAKARRCDAAERDADAARSELRRAERERLEAVDELNRLRGESRGWEERVDVLREEWEREREELTERNARSRDRVEEEHARKMREVEADHVIELERAGERAELRVAHMRSEIDEQQTENLMKLKEGEKQNEALKTENAQLKEEISDLRDRLTVSQRCPTMALDVQRNQTLFNSALQRSMRSKEDEIERLRGELVMMRSTTTTTSTSTNLHATPPPHPSTSSSSSQPSARCAREREKITFCNFQRDDLVLVVYDAQHHHHVLFASSAHTMYFIHTESLHQLALTKNDTDTRRLARFVDKEYCQAKKSNNRFNVEVGCKFFRVRLAPVSRRTPTTSNQTTTS